MLRVRDSVTNNFLVKIFATPPRAVALRPSSPRHSAGCKFIVAKATEISITAGQGLEPQYLAPEASVLPLDEPAMCKYNLPRYHPPVAELRGKQLTIYNKNNDK